MSKRTKNINMGSVSCGTMRSEDLIPTFLYELQNQKPLRKEHRQLARDIEDRVTNGIGYFDTENADYDLADLSDALDEYAPEYFYFGAHPGDGADYGYWLSENWDEDALSAEEWIAYANGLALLTPGHCDLLKVSDLAEIPKDFVGQVALVNDHGNVTLYWRGKNHRLYEIWSVV